MKLIRPLHGVSFHVVVLLIISSTLLLSEEMLTPVAEVPFRSSNDDTSQPSGLDFGSERKAVPLYMFVRGPQYISGFASSVTTLGDVQGDGVDDLIVGNRSPVQPLLSEGRVRDKLSDRNFLLPGRIDRLFEPGQLDGIDNISSDWPYHAERWLGDVNDDGYDDMVSRPYELGSLLSNSDLGPLANALPFIQIRYGSANGLPDEPNLVIDLRPPDLPEGTRISSHFGGVGDVNGDDFDDLVVVRQRIVFLNDGGRNMEMESLIPPDFQLFLGSEDGLPSEPNWNTSIEEDWDHWWLTAIHHADVNADGYSDVILTSNTTPQITIHHGSTSGLRLEPDMNITFDSHAMEDWQLHTPVEINGDEYDDIVLSYRTAGGPPNQDHYISIFEGSAEGIPAQPPKEYKLSSNESSLIVLSDLNNDGLHDVMIAYLEETSEAVDPPSQTLNFHAYFNAAGAFSENPSWKHSIDNLTGCFLGSLDSGDYDKDGFGDVALGLPGREYWAPPTSYPGNVVLVFGGGLMDLIKPIELTGGPICYAGYQAYDFRIDVNPMDIVDLPSSVVLTLDPGGEDVIVQWIYCRNLSRSNQFSVVQDPECRIRLESTESDMEQDEANNTILLHFRIFFNWNWSHEDMCDVDLTTLGHGDTLFYYRAKQLFRVENDLDFHGTLSARGDWQGPLGNGDWIRANEAVTLSGPVIVYEGTIDIHPPDGVCDVVLQDNDGDFTNASLISGRLVNLTIMADTSTDLDENLSLSLQNLPGTATIVSNPEIRLRVDGAASTFRNAIPEADDWHSSSSVTVSITADDIGTSGVRASSIQYSYLSSGSLSFNEWSRADLDTTPDGELVECNVVIPLPDGENNYVRWRAKDLVGNGYSISDDLQIKVDTKNVTYTNPVPNKDAWQPDSSVLCGVIIRDISGSGIDVTRVQYRFSFRNVSRYGPWMDWDEGSTQNASIVNVSTLLEMAETIFNRVQWRAIDIAGNGYTTSPHYRIKVDTTPIEFSDFRPTEPCNTNKVRWWANVSDKEGGSQVDMSSLAFRYKTVGEGWSDWVDLQMKGAQQRTFISGSFDLPDGLGNVMQLKGMDVAGNGPTLSEGHSIVVDTTGPTFLEITPGPDDKQPSPVVTVMVVIEDNVIGLDIYRVEYRFGTNGQSSMGDWSPLPVEAYDDRFIGTIKLYLARGRNNHILFRARDCLNNQATSSMSTIWVNRIPTAIISSPEDGTTYVENELVQLSADGSLDPDGDELNYTWYIEGWTEYLAYGEELEIVLPVGFQNLTLSVKDPEGEEAITAVIITVEPSPPQSETEAGFWLPMLIILILVFLLVVGLSHYLHRRRLFSSPIQEHSRNKYR